MLHCMVITETEIFAVSTRVSMGCVHGKHTSTARNRNLESLKRQNAYASRASASAPPKPLSHDDNSRTRISISNSNSKQVVEEKEESQKRVSVSRDHHSKTSSGGQADTDIREKEKEKEKGVANAIDDLKSNEIENVSKTSEFKKKKKIASYEFVDGWPKWLVDNIPKEVLSGLVPRSAHSYEKLDKVSINP